MAPTQKMLGSVWFYVLVHRPLCTKNTESEKKTTNKQMLPSAWNQIFWIVKQEDHWAALLCFHEQIEVFAKVYFRPSSPLHDSNIISIASHLHYFFVFVCLFSIQHALFGKTYYILCVFTLAQVERLDFPYPTIPFLFVLHFHSVLYMRIDSRLYFFLQLLFWKRFSFIYRGNLFFSSRSITSDEAKKITIYPLPLQFACAIRAATQYCPLGAVFSCILE